MHSHDRTLLASLGFADLDKKNDRHDCACRYLTQPEIALNLVNYATAAPAKEQQWELSQVERVVLERHITKGKDQYRTTIGFVDCLIDFQIFYQEAVLEEDRSSGWGVWKDTGQFRGARGNEQLLVEVKIQPVPVGDIMRQIGLYREYRLTPKWTTQQGILCRCYRLPTFQRRGRIASG